MNVRFLPEGAIFSNTIHALFISEQSLWEALGYLNSELVFYLVRVFEIRKIPTGQWRISRIPSILISPMLEDSPVRRIKFYFLNG